MCVVIGLCGLGVKWWVVDVCLIACAVCE